MAVRCPYLLTTSNASTRLQLPAPTHAVALAGSMQALREEICKLYDTVTAEQVVVCVPEEGGP